MRCPGLLAEFAELWEQMLQGLRGAISLDQLKTPKSVKPFVKKVG